MQMADQQLECSYAKGSKTMLKYGRVGLWLAIWRGFSYGLRRLHTFLPDWVGLCTAVDPGLLLPGFVWVLIFESLGEGKSPGSGQKMPGIPKDLIH